MSDKSNQVTAQLDMFQPAQLGLDLRTDEQKERAERVICKTEYLDSVLIETTCPECGCPAFTHIANIPGRSQRMERTTCTTCNYHSYSYTDINP